MDQFYNPIENTNLEREKLIECSRDHRTHKIIKSLVQVLSWTRDREHAEEILNSLGEPEIKYSIKVVNVNGKPAFLKLLAIFCDKIYILEFKGEKNFLERELVKRGTKIKELYYDNSPYKAKLEEEKLKKKQLQEQIELQKRIDQLPDTISLDPVSEHQLMAVVFRKPCYIMSAAGTGKTTTLINRFYHLIKSERTKLDRILFIANSKKEVLRIKRIIKNKTGLKELKFEWICTFHGLCQKILKSDPEKFKDVRILSEPGRKNIIGKICLDMCSQGSPEFLSNVGFLIDQLKTQNSDEYILDFSKQWKISEEKAKRISNEYSNVLYESNLLDLTDLENAANLILDNNSEIREKLASEFDAILIDDFQNVNQRQFEIIKKITDSNSNILVAGNPHQRIKIPENSFEMFVGHFDNAKQFYLRENHRSTRIIMDISESLIKQSEDFMTLRRGNRLMKGEKIVYRREKSKLNEIDSIIHKALNLIREKKVKAKDIAILYRHKLRQDKYEYLRHCCSRNEISIRDGGTWKDNFFNSLEIKFIVSALNVSMFDVVCFSDLIIIWEVLKDTIISLNGLECEEIRQFCIWAQGNNYSLEIAIENLQNLEEFREEARRIMRIFHRELVSWKYRLNRENIDVWIEEFLVTRVNLGRCKESNTESYENINTMIRTLRDARNKLGKLEIIKGILTFNYEKYKNIADKVQGITFSSIKEAQGSEWDYVFLMGFDNKFPNLSEKVDMEEERRLAYIAFTRAKKGLFISGVVRDNNEESHFMDFDLKKSGNILMYD